MKVRDPHDRWQTFWMAEDAVHLDGEPRLRTHGLQEEDAHAEDAVLSSIGHGIKTIVEDDHHIIQDAVGLDQVPAEVLVALDKLPE